MNEDDLPFLNRLIVERLKLIGQARSTVMLAHFSIGRPRELSELLRPAKERSHRPAEQERPPASPPTTDNNGTSIQRF